MMKAVALVTIMAAAASAQLVKVVYDLDEPSPQAMANVGALHPDCSSFYRVQLSSKYTSQGNDLGHSPVQGKDTTYSSNPDDFTELTNAIKSSFEEEYSSYQNIGANLVGEPGRNDPAKQARARALQSVTALTEPGSTPLGFFEANMHYHYGVCVEVHGIQPDNGRQNVGVSPADSLGGRWLEIMAETLVKDQQICVADYGHLDTHEDPATSECGQGELYQCREADIKMGQNGAYGNTGNANDRNTKGRNGEGTMLFKFFCQENCDDPDVKFRFRIAVQQIKPRRNAQGRFVQPDGEDWCATRKGDDYPSSLLSPYPKGYSEPTIFDKASSATAVTASAVAAVAAVAFAALF